MASNGAQHQAQFNTLQPLAFGCSAIILRALPEREALISAPAARCPFADNRCRWDSATAGSTNDYVPTACPGGRPPHLWLADSRSLYDTLGFEFTLLHRGTKPAEEARRLLVSFLPKAAKPTLMSRTLKRIPACMREYAAR
jgi:hypothetical protein